MSIRLSAVLLTVPLLLPGAAVHFRKLYQFTGGADGAHPQGLAAGRHGELYGVTAYGGAFNAGTVFELMPPQTPGGAWTQTTLYSFTGQNGDGANPFATPVVARDGAIYGTTDQGGYPGGGGLGTVWQLRPPSTRSGAWTEKVLYSNFGSTDPNLGTGLLRSLVLGANGEIYGVTAYEGFAYNGTIFCLTKPASGQGQWTAARLYAFQGNADGAQPAGIILSPDGVIYGATSYGGTAGAGTIFALTPDAVPGFWTKSTLYSFTGGYADGAAPFEPPILLQGALYGTTTAGGSGGMGTVFQLAPPVVSSWTLNKLFDFGADSANPGSPLIVRDNIIFGATVSGNPNTGTNLGGTIFALQQQTTYPYAWVETVFHGFPGQAGPYGGLVMDHKGAIYGTTTSGPGPAGAGMVYKVIP